MGTKSLSSKRWILLPGTLCTGAVFDGFLDVLGVPHPMRHHVELDRPKIEDYCAIFENVSEDTIVCGFSLGAIIAAHFADRMAAQSIVLFGVNPYPDDPAKAQSRIDLATDVKARGGAAALRMRTSAVYGESSEKTLEAIFQMADASADGIDAQTQLALTRPGTLSTLAKARMSVLSLTGSHDSSAPPSQGLAAAQAAPNGQFHSLEGLGHFALLADPSACASALAHLMETQHDTV